jgi:GTP-binding protein LepA
MPLAEVIIDFFDRLKSTTKGYASIEYNITEFKASNLIKLDVLLNNDVVDALSIIIHKDFAMSRGREVAKNLQKLIPRQMFDIPIQVALGSKIISRETVKALRRMLLQNVMVEISRVKRNCLKTERRQKENETVWQSFNTSRSIFKLLQFRREIMFGDPIFILSLLQFLDS